MPKKKPLQEVEEVGRKVADYIRTRLAAECEEHRGRAADVARVTGLTPSMVSQVRRGESPAGPKFAGAIARYWGMTIDQLEAVALGRGEAPEAETPKPPSSVVVKDPPDASELRRLGDVPGWDEAVEEAIQLFGDSLSRDDYAAASALRGLDLPERVDAAAAAHWAKTCAWQRARNERMKKEMAEAAAELAAWRKAQGQ